MNRTGISVTGSVKIGLAEPVEVTCHCGAGGRHQFTFRSGKKRYVDSLIVAEQWQRAKCSAEVCRRFGATHNDEPDPKAMQTLDGSMLNAVEKLAEKIAENPDDDGRSPVMLSLSDVESKPIDWLWPNRFALGKLSLIIGDPGNGKSYWSLDVASRISTAARWPDGSGHAPLGSVILMGVEDDLADTVKPRLEAAGADTTKIVALTGVANKDSEGQYERTVDLRRDIPVIETALKSVEQCRAIILDPISAFLGKTDSHVNAEVRETLAPLAQLAERYGVAIIAITHLRKGETAALHRAMGSVAFTAAARSVWAIARDKRDPDGKRRLLLPVKSNIAECSGGLAFTLTKRHASSAMPHIEYEPDPVTDSADDALSNEPRRRGPEPEAESEAENYLRDALANGPRPAKELIEEAREVHCIAKRTLDRAKLKIGLQTYRPEHRGPWWWKLPDCQASDCQTDTAYKQLGNLGNLSGNPKKTDYFAAPDSYIAKFPVRGNLSDNGHDLDAINAELASNDDDEPEACGVCGEEFPLGANFELLEHMYECEGGDDE